MAHAKRVGPAIGAGLALILSLVACGGDKTDTGGGGDSNAAGFKGGTLTVYHTNDLEHLDPARNFVTDSNMVGKLIGRTLTEFRFDAKSKKIILEPDLAAKWENSPDLKTWTFHLKDNLKYEDGSPITTKDIKYNVERSFSADLAEGSPYAKEYLDCPGYKGPYTPAGNNGGKGCTAIDAPDEKTIIFKLNRPVAEFDATVSMKNWTPVPAAKDTKTQYDNHPFSSGPYKIETYIRKKSLVLVRNDHWDPKSDVIRTARPDKIVFKFGDDVATVDQRLIANGTADQSSVAFSAVEPQNLGKINQANVKDRVVEGTDVCRRYIAFNQQKPLFKNQKMREALLYGFNKQAYITARGGEKLNVIVDTIIPEEQDGYRPDEIWKLPPEGDQAKAKTLLQEAGYNGEKVVLGSSDTKIAGKAAEAAQAAWKAIGVNVEIKKIPGDNYYSTQQNDAAATDLITAGWCEDWPHMGAIVNPVFGPDTSTPGKAAQNNYARSQAQWDKIAEIVKMTDKKAAVDAWSDVYAEIMKTAPIVPISKDNNVYVVGSNIDNAVPDPNTGGLIDLVQVGLKKSN